jgi:hypothetical protein
MTDWLRMIDRGISIREKEGDPPVFTVEEMSDRLAAVLDPDEPDPKKRELMNLCFDALVCVREMAARREPRTTAHRV